VPRIQEYEDLALVLQQVRDILRVASFVVGLSRTRKACHVISVGRLGA
jgi:hypothetical protein